MLLRIFVLCCALVASGCSQNGEPTLRIGTGVWPGYEPLYLARQLGHLDSDRIRLIEYTSTSQVMKAYRSGLIDGAAVTLDEAISLQAAGENVRVVLVLDVSDGADALVAHQDIARLEDLEGKRIGVEHSALGAYLISRIIARAQLDESQLQIVPLEVNRHQRAFVNRQVDAVVTFEPVRSRLLENGGQVLFDSSQIPGEIVDVLIVRADRLPQFGGQVEYLQNVWFEVIAQIKKSPQLHLADLNSRLRLEEKDARAAFSAIRFPDRTDNQRMLSASGKNNLLQLSREMTKLMHEHRLIQARVNTDVMFIANNPQ